MGLMDNAEHRRLSALIQAGGGVYVGVGAKEDRNQLLYFHDPQTRSTLALPLAGVTSDEVRHRLAESRESFAAAPPKRIRPGSP